MNHRHIGSKIFSANTHILLWSMHTTVLDSIVIVCMQMIKIKNENLFISSEIYPSFFNPIYKQQQAYFREKSKGSSWCPGKRIYGTYFGVRRSRCVKCYLVCHFYTKNLTRCQNHSIRCQTPTEQHYQQKTGNSINKQASECQTIACKQYCGIFNSLFVH